MKHRLRLHKIGSGLNITKIPVPVTLLLNKISHENVTISIWYIGHTAQFILPVN